MVEIEEIETWVENPAKVDYDELAIKFLLYKEFENYGRLSISYSVRKENVIGIVRVLC